MSAQSRNQDSNQVQAAGKLRMLRALEAIERAQNELLTACQQLSALEGAAKAYVDTGRMYDRVKAHWYKVHNVRMSGRYRLDSMHREIIESKAAVQS